jgi:hypothetical protein
MTVTELVIYLILVVVLAAIIKYIPEHYSNWGEEYIDEELSKYDPNQELKWTRKNKSKKKKL